MVSKELRKPLQALKERVETLINGEEDLEQVRYMLYSAHDTQVSTTMFVLSPYKYDFKTVPFASNIFFELYYDE